MRNNIKAFTLVEMIVAMAVSAIIVAATYASYDLVANQYKKNADIAELHSSGRSIMQMIEREVRMAGFAYRDSNGTVTYGGISSPLVIKDSGNKCCDDVTLIYDKVNDVLDWKGNLVSSSVDRIKIRFWAEAHTSNKGDRFRLYKQKTILGRNNALLSKPIVSNREVMADFIVDFQIANVVSSSSLFAGSQALGTLRSYDRTSQTWNPHTIFKTQSNAPIGVLALAFGLDNKLYVGGYEGGTLRSYDTATKTWNFEGQHIKWGTPRGAISLAFGADGILYVGGYKAFSSYDPVAKTWTELGVFRTNRREVNVDALAYAPNGLLYLGSQWTADQFNLRTYNPVTKNYGSIRDSHMFRYKRGRNLGVRSLTFCPDGLLYVGSMAGLIRSFNPVTKAWGDDVIFTNKNGQVISADALACENGILYAGSESDGVIRPFNPVNKVWGNQITFTNNSNRVIGVRALATKTQKSGQESLVSINLTLRSKNKFGKDKQFKKKDYFSGNFLFDQTDKYIRDTFSSKVLVRNLM